MKDPITPEEWQDAVNAAEFMRLVQAARAYGLVTYDAPIDLARCDKLLARGRARGITPAPIEEILGR